MLPPNQDDMRRAGHDALLQCDGATFGSLAEAEADRIEDILVNGERREGCMFTWIAGQRCYGDKDERQDIRRRAVAILRRVSGDSPLARISDDDLLAEVARRGLDVSV